MMLKNNLKALAMGFNNEKYWSRRDIIFDLKTPRLLKAFMDTIS